MLDNNNYLEFDDNVDDDNINEYSWMIINDDNTTIMCISRPDRIGGILCHYTPGGPQHHERETQEGQQEWDPWDRMFSSASGGNLRWVLPWRTIPPQLFTYCARANVHVTIIIMTKIH